ncbi:MAG: anthranilate/aminodeoxychorismate synthase component II, partial [Methylibium sp.]|nr:anthranilate/aminodeoxychorismate synthase component II [Methylibium sp.]
IVRAKTQMHGKASTITTDQKGVFKSLPKEFSVIRYHSLVIEEATMPQVLEISARSEDGEIMGVRHRELAGTRTPLEGVQFHPESILSEHGHAMLKNFLELAL